MIYKVFYQETKERSPRRETTRALYLDIDASSELEGRIAARQLVEENRPEYNIEYIELLSDKIARLRKRNWRLRNHGVLIWPILLNLKKSAFCHRWSGRNREKHIRN